MKFIRAIFLGMLLASIVGNVGCSVAPAVQEHMIIAPHSIVFSSSTIDSTVSITHSCTCPFSWNATISPPVSWLSFPESQTGDKTDVPIAIVDSLLTADTNRATILIASNSYGDDSILVTAIK
jgi:hypothetical protein